MYLATALRESFKEGYGIKNLKKDFVAGMVVSLVALPLSMALSIAVGLPPQHGIYSAIIAGIIVALLGGSRTQVTGPTAAFVVVLVICFSLTVLIDMVAGVTAGVIMATLLLVKSVTDATHVELTSGKDNEDHVKLPKGTMVYRIDGPLFFGTVEKALDRYNFVKAGKVKTLIIDIRNVPFVDISGLVAFKSMILYLTKKKVAVAICGEGEVIAQIKRKLKNAKVRGVSFIDSIAIQASV